MSGHNHQFHLMDFTAAPALSDVPEGLRPLTTAICKAIAPSPHKWDSDDAVFRTISDLACNGYLDVFLHMSRDGSQAWFFFEEIMPYGEPGGTRYPSDVRCLTDHGARGWLETPVLAGAA